MRAHTLSLLAVLSALACLATGETVQDASWALAQQQYPELRDANSAMYRVFQLEQTRLRRDKPSFFDDPEWPLALAHALVPQRVRLRFTVFQNTGDGSLLDATIGTYGKYATAVDWAAPSILDGHRRADIVMKDGVRFSGEKQLVFVFRLKDYAEKQSGEIDVYPAGDYSYSNAFGAARRVPRFTLTASESVAFTWHQ